MAIPDYCDKRAKKYFSRGFVGHSHGEDGTGYRYSWDSSSGASPTKMITGIGNPRCAYCGNEGLPLQPYFTASFDPDCNTTITGYACICKDAMDQLEVEDKLDQMALRHASEVRELQQQLPNVNKIVLKKLLDEKVKRQKEEIDRGFLDEKHYKKFGLEIE